MATEAVRLEARDGGVAEGSAEVLRYSSGQRLGKALGVGIGGTVLGLCTIVIPGLHFVTTWLVPLLSIGAGVYLYGRRGAVDGVRAECPTCSAAMEPEGGAWEEPMWIRCNHCNIPLQVKLASPM